MKLFVDAFGGVALLCLRRLIEQKQITSENILVKTYEMDANQGLLDFLKTQDITFFFGSYSVRSIVHIQRFKPDIIISLFARERIPVEVIDITKWSMNLHPSLLPKLKGCFSVPWAIINNAEVTGITFHELSEQFDEGKVIFQKACKIHPDDTAQSLYSRLNYMFYSYFIYVFDGYVNGELIPEPQPLNDDSYYPRVLPYNGVVDPNWSNEMKERFTRAMYFPPFVPALDIQKKLYTLISNL